MIVLLLLWSHFGLSSSQGPDPQKNVPSKTESREAPQDTRALEEMSVTPPGPLMRSDEVTFFYPYPSSLTLIAGTSSLLPPGSWSPSDTQSVFGLNVLWPSLKHFHWESGIDILTNNTGRFFTVGRWISNMTGRTRPYYSFGPGVWLKPEYQIATLIRYQNFFARLAAGLEWSYSQSGSLKAEAVAAMALDGSAFLGATLGLTFGIN